MKFYILLWLIDVFANWVSCQSSDLLIYRIALMEHSHSYLPKITTWTFERNIWSEVLFVWPDVESDGSLLTVSSRRLSDSEFLSSFNAWKTMRQDFKYLRVSCAATEDRASVCICTKYTRSHDSSIPAEATNSSDWTRSSMSECNSLPPLTSRVFRDFRNLELVELDMVELHHFESDAFSDLVSLTFFRLSNYSIAPRAVMNGTLCGLRKLLVIEIYGNGQGHNDSNDFLPFLQCDITKTGIESNFGSIIDIKNTSFSSITKHTFDSLNPFDFLVLFAMNNMITDIEDEAFVRFKQLYQLDISENQLTTLRPHSFRGLTNLLELNLAYNRLETVNVAVFENLPLLKGLNLTGNRLMHLNGRFSLVPQLITLGLGFNRLKNVNATTFANSYKLMKLWLDFNEIATISPSAFTGCPYLYFIDLNDNLLDNTTHIQQFLQSKIQNLGILKLSNNNISNLLPLMFSQHTDLNPLQLLSFDSNQIKTVDKDAFTNLTALSLLVLGKNRLTYLHPETFKTNLMLKTLYLPENCLESIPEMSESLESLDLASNCIKHLPLFSKTMNNLKILQLCGNQLGSLNENSFDQFPSLVGLDVSRCSLRAISKDTLHNNSKLVQIDLSQNDLNINFSIDYWRTQLDIRWVNLSYNSIRSAKDLFLHKIRNALTIDLSHNPLVVFPDQTRPGSNVQQIIYTERLFLKNCNLMTVSDSALEMAINLVLVDLSSNNLTQFKPFRLHDRVKNTAYKVMLDDNPIMCSCEMSWLKDDQYRLHYSVPFCIRVTTGNLEPFSSIPKADFLCRVTKICTVELPECECYTDDLQNAPTQLDCSHNSYTIFPQNLDPSLKIIFFEGNSLTAFKSDFVLITLNDLEKLSLRNNKIVEVEPHCFEKFPHLLILDLSENRIVNISRETFSMLRRLECLYLNNNFITTIDGWAFGKLSLLNILLLHGNHLELLTTDNMADIKLLSYLRKLTLDDNPWSCPCDNGTFKNWIQQRSEIIPNTFEILCNDTPIVSIPDENLICYDLSSNVLTDQFFVEIIAFSSMFGVLLITTLLLVYRFRHVLQVLLFSTFGFRVNRKENELCCYDTFTVYDNSDVFVRKWIQNEFLDHLEPRYKLFIPDRDMLAGTDKSNELVKSVKLSHRTIVVISNAAVKVHEVSFVFEVAYHHMTLEHSEHDLLLILLDGVCCKKLRNESELDANLKAYLKTDKCLSVSDKLFWQKLHFFLPNPRPGIQSDDGYPVRDYC